jgi:hypothetical protein
LSNYDGVDDCNDTDDDDNDNDKNKKIKERYIYMDLY